jgi:hypothetical protein
MCSKPKIPKPDTRLQEQSLELQKEQLQMAKENSRQQNAMAIRNMQMAYAPPPPKPNPTAQVAALPLDSGDRMVYRGTGRRRLRTDRSYSTLAIPR